MLGKSSHSCVINLNILSQIRENAFVISCKMSQKLYKFPTFFGRFPQGSRTRCGSVPGICRQRALVRSPDVGGWWGGVCLL